MRQSHHDYDGNECGVLVLRCFAAVCCFLCCSTSFKVFYVIEVGCVCKVLLRNTPIE